VIDVHSYGESESLSTNPHQQPNFLASIAPAQIYGKPVSITEWNVPFPKADRFIAPLYLASIASLQGWDVPMLYNYSQTPLQRPGPEEWRNEWSTFCDPAISGIMPAAAVAFRQGHISSARTTYCLKLSPEQLLGTHLEPKNAATVRTLVEQSRLTIGIPAVKELPWLKPSEPSKDVTIVTDPNHDFIPTGQFSVRSDTGELARDWKDGIQTIDTPRTQAVSGGIGGKVLELKDTTFELRTKKAVVALTSIDNQPLSSSRFIMITAIGQARRITDMGKKIPIKVHSQTPFVSEPVIGTITLRTKISDLDLLSLGPASKVVSRMTPAYEQGSLTFALPAGRGTHWYVLKARPSEPVGKPSAPSANP
jgi:hypothetical protein